MKKRAIVFVLAICVVVRVCGQFPDLTHHTVISEGTVSFNYHCDDLQNVTNGCAFEAQKMKMEVPPWMIPGGWHSYFMVDGQNSYVCSSPADLVHNSVIDIRHDGTGPRDVSTHALARYGNGCRGAEVDNWSRVYYAIYSAEYFVHPEAGAVSLGFLHGENKDVCDGGGNDCHNTINRDAVNVCPFSGDYWPRYNSFVCASWQPNNQSTNWGQQYFSHDMGPITWPSTGYLQPDGIKATTGVNHPSSIQYNGYVYVFYHDAGAYSGLNPHDEEGRHEGIKVVRAPLADALDPSAYKAYYQEKDGNEQWSPSLPAGFVKEKLLDFLSTKGAMSTDLMGDEGNNAFGELRFAVARVRNTDYFIGVESYIDYKDGRKHKAALRLSSDLLHWSDRVRVIDETKDFKSSQLNYPIFLSADGWSNSVVDEDDFYVLGTAAAISNVVYKKHIFLHPQASFAQVLSLSGSGPVSPGPSVPLSVTAVAPNPGRGLFRVDYTLMDYALVRVNVLDITGRRLQSGSPEQRGPGANTETVDLSGRVPGMYLMEVLAGSSRQVAKVLVQ
ncbi:MAG TPA: T9SS type A sorting domain-containing protein [Puia sp.]|nr:T9SS type A sorting domain-containing protein [Puia sp.]